MHIPRLYITQTLQENSVVTLDAAASHHVATVMRMKTGSTVTVFNGLPFNGILGEFNATLMDVHKKNTTVVTGDFVARHTESPLAIELGACLIKSDRMGWLLQKATELGVTTISPVLSHFTDVKMPASLTEKKMRHWQQIVISACEQAGRVRIPTINAPQKMDVWLEHVRADKKWVLHPHVGSVPVADMQMHSVALLTGPEGGLTDSEVDLAIQHQFNGWELGPRILRAETASLAALTQLQAQYGDCHAGSGFN